MNPDVESTNNRIERYDLIPSVRNSKISGESKSERGAEI